MSEFTYDPHSDPVAEDWLALDEEERIHLVMTYHEAERIRLSNLRLHAVIHTIVENQIAEGAQIPVEGHLRRLMREGLDRHEAIHAIGSVLANHMYAMLSDEQPGGDPNRRYYRELDNLTAASWRSGE